MGFPAVQVQAFDQEELRLWLRHMAAVALLPSGGREVGPEKPQLTSEQLHAWHLTAGNPNEMRKHMAALFN